MRQEEFEHLLDKYKAGNCTPDEVAFIESWYLTYEEPHVEKPSLTDTTEDLDKVWELLNGVLHKKQTPIWRRMVIAASILIFLTIGGYYLLQYKRPGGQQIAKNQKHVIVPGGNRAILTLSNGTQIILTNAHNGTLAQQGTTSITKTANGSIVYKASAGATNAALTYNTMTTPNGGQYWITLPDESKVLLNAASSLRYPTTFTGKERKVELLTGEAYFEIVHNSAAPFRVITAGQVVEDTGTEFNINAYNDEHLIKTTLLAGGVKIIVENQHATLQPGQQSQVTTNSEQQNIQVIEQADTKAAIAWKNGLFDFKNASVQQVMNNAARWYDLNVIYEGEKPDLKITGRISRQVNFSGLIDLLQYEGLKCKIDGRNVIVY